MTAKPRATAPGRAPTGETHPSNANAREFEAFLDETVPAQLDEHDVAGATVAVVAEGEVKVAKGYGYADVEAEEPVRADETLFDLASVSKSVTGTAVMRAVQADLVALDTDVNEYLDSFSLPDTYAAPITLEHLGTHTAGFAPQHIGEYTFEEDGLPPLDAAVAEDPPERVRPPGEIASYSNYGFALAGHVLGAAAGETFADYVRNSVFEPLGMERSSFRLPRPDDVDQSMTNAYAADDGEFREVEGRVSWRRPAGGMVATATDMARFMLMHLQRGRLGQRRFLPATVVEGMHAERFDNHPAIDSVGYGFIEETRGETRFVGMTGNSPAFQTAMALFPAEEVGLFVAYNTRGAGAARNELVDAFVEEYAPPGEPAPLDPDDPPARADDLVGSYRHTRIAERSVAKVLGAAGTLQVRVADDGTLVTQPEVPGPTARWVEIEPLVFRKVDGHQRLAFRENRGEITYAFLSAQSGLERIQPHDRTLVHLGITAVFLLAFLGALFGWTGAWIWRRYQGRPTLAGGPLLARIAAGVSGLLLLSVLVGGVVALATNGRGLLTGLPRWFSVLLGFPTVGAVLALVGVGWSALAWRERYWGPIGRVHYTLLAISSLAVAWVLAYWNLPWTPF